MNIQKQIIGSSNIEKRENRPNHNNINISDILINSAKKSSSSCEVRNTDLKHQALKLYNLTEKNAFNNFDSANSISSNNAYNSLTECYKIGTGEQISADMLLQNLTEFNKNANSSLNMVKVNDFNDKLNLMYAGIALQNSKINVSEGQNSSGSKRKIKSQHKSPYNGSGKHHDIPSSKKRSIETDSKDILASNIPNTYHTDTRYKIQLAQNKGNESILKAQIINAKNERS